MRIDCVYAECLHVLSPCLLSAEQTQATYPMAPLLEAAGGKFLIEHYNEIPVVGDGKFDITFSFNS